MPGLCRDCDTTVEGPSCPACGGMRVVRHPELFSLAIAHIDCDAFYAAVEKRDHPEWQDKPLIVGGGVRGVVSTCCYIARLYGVRSAMPMFKARKLCPQAMVVRPDMAKYAAISRQVRAMMETLTPLVQPLSIDEAALDLSGTQALHGAPPAIVLSRLARRIEAELGITISIGLATNRMLAKLAAERGKPRGFHVLGAEAPALLADEKASLLPGIGPAQAKRLEAAGIITIGQLAGLDERAAAKLGHEGPALVDRARLRDTRPIRPDRESKSISAETTFETDIADLATLEAELWPLCEKLGRRLYRENQAAAGLVLKLKTADFQLRTRSQRLPAPTRLAETLFEAARPLLARETDGATPFRLIGIGAAPLASAALADLGDLADTATPRRRARQEAIDQLRARFGEAAVQRGRALRTDKGKD
ncbi:DNA polymerase IV [Acidocella sp.]|uniref:DNA polymerase IV n=1 Tax=Acidocella sp. TaxID=50710 RepID=UPI003D03DF48